MAGITPTGAMGLSVDLTILPNFKLSCPIPKRGSVPTRRTYVNTPASPCVH